jgi:hypothetical protein
MIGVVERRVDDLVVRIESLETKFTTMLEREKAQAKKDNGEVENAR